MNLRIPTPAQFLNRELEILEFNRRVLAQAADEAVPLLERLRFITIVSSNLDEFFEIRVAGLKEQIKLGLPEPGPDGNTPVEVFAAVSAGAHALVSEKYKLLNETVLPALARESVVFPRREEWSAAQRQWIRDYFFRELLPVLTPIGLDPAHPFPRVFNKSLNLAVELEGRDAFGRSSRAAIVQAPRALPRVIRLPPEVAGAEFSFVFLSSILHANVGELFSGMHVQACCTRRRGSLRGPQEEGRAAAPPVPVVPAGNRFHPHHRERSRGHRHQADGVPHGHRLGADGDPGRCGAQGEGSHRGGRADGAVRRGSES